MPVSCQSACWFTREAHAFKQAASSLPGMGFLPAQRLLSCGRSSVEATRWPSCANRRFVNTLTVARAYSLCGAQSAFLTRWSYLAHAGISCRPTVSTGALPLDSTAGDMLVHGAEASMATSTLVLGCLFSMLGSKPTGLRGAAAAVASTHADPSLPQHQQQLALQGRSAPAPAHHHVPGASGPAQNAAQSEQGEPCTSGENGPGSGSGDGGSGTGDGGSGTGDGGSGTGDGGSGTGDSSSSGGASGAGGGDSGGDRRNRWGSNGGWGGGWFDGFGAAAGGGGGGGGGFGLPRGGIAACLLAMAAVLACLGPWSKAVQQLLGSDCGHQPQHHHQPQQLEDPPQPQQQQQLPGGVQAAGAVARPCARWMLPGGGSGGVAIRVRRLTCPGAAATRRLLGVWPAWLPLYEQHYMYEQQLLLAWDGSSTSSDQQEAERRLLAARVMQEQGTWLHADPYGFWHGGEERAAALRPQLRRNQARRSASSSHDGHSSGSGGREALPSGLQSGTRRPGGLGHEARQRRRTNAQPGRAVTGVAGGVEGSVYEMPKLEGHQVVLSLRDEIAALGAARDGLQAAHDRAEVWLAGGNGGVAQV